MSEAALRIDEGIWDTEQVALYLKVPVKTIQRWVLNDEIPSIKIGRHRRFIKEEIDKWLKRRQSKVL